MRDTQRTGENRAKPTFAGWALGLSALAFLVAGLIRKDAAMMSVGVIAAAAVMLAWLFARIHGRHLDFQMSVPPHVEVGRRFVCRVCVWNSSRWCDVWRLRIHVHPFVPTEEEGLVSWVAVKGVAVVDVEVVAEKRGSLRAARIEWRADAPFGLMVVQRSAEVPISLLVRPRALWPWKNHQRGVWGARTADASRTAGWGEWGETRGARPWRSGDRAKHILWPATLRSVARGSVWMSRESDPPREGWASYTVVFHSFGIGGALIRPESFELALCHIAGVVKNLLTEGRRVRVLADFNDWRPWDCSDGHSLSRLWNHLATVQRAVGTEAHELARVLESIKPCEGIVVLSDFPLSCWESAIPEAARRAWLPDAASGRRKRLEVGV